MVSSTIKMNRLTSTTAGVIPMSAWTDEDLLAVYRTQANRLAFEELVHRYERELFSYLRRYLGDSAMAEDTFQATFLQVHLKCDQFETGRKVRPWLYTIATNQAIDAQRRNRRHRMVSLDRRQTSDGAEDVGSLMELLESKESGPVARLESDERRDWIQRHIGQLPESLRSAVNLIYYQGLKYREAAEVLDVPVGTVKSRLHTAILKLNAAWNSGRSSKNAPATDHPDRTSGEE
jgi:RNA polymerase sigma-70 factor (ECF subfamily)